MIELGTDLSKGPSLDLADPEINARWNAAESLCQQIRHALAVGADQLAIRKLQYAMRVLSGLSKDEKPFLARPLADLKGLDQRVLNSVEANHNVQTIGEALNVPAAVYKTATNFGDDRFLNLVVSILRASVEEIARLEAQVEQLKREKHAQ